MNAHSAIHEAPLVDIRDLTVQFAGFGPARIDHLSLRIRRGECVALVGESGSGKSVTARTIIGQTGLGARITADAVEFDGRDTRAFTQAEWRRVRGDRIGFVMQDALGSLDPLRTIGKEVGEPIDLHRKLSRRERDERVLELLRSVGVPEPELRVLQRSTELSGGQRQRALIASAIACDPELLIADEPTTALDAVVQAQVVRLLQGLRRADRAMLIVSHDLGVVSHLADRIAVMRQGKIIEEGPAHRIFSAPDHRYTRELLDAARAIHASSLPAAALRSPAQKVGGEVLMEARRVSKNFVGPDRRRRTAVDQLSFTLKRGETLGIVGESGSGKTTLTRLVLGLEQADEGEILLQGRRWRDLSGAERRAQRKRIQVVFQDPLASFDPRYTVRRVLEEAISVAGIGGRQDRTERAKDLLRLVQLDIAVLDRRPIALSGGQRQRVAIARALAPSPDVLVCDEPVSALDVYVQAQVLDLLADLKKRLGLSCLFISHDLGVVRRIADHVIVMKDGRAVEQGLVEDIFSRPSHSYTRALIDAVLPVDAPRRAKHA